MNDQKRLCLPLPQSQHPKATLTPEREAELRQLAKENIRHTVNKLPAAWYGTKHIFDGDGPPEDWKVHHVKPNLTLYRRRSHKGSSPTYRRFMATARVSGLSLEDVVYGTTAETTIEHRAECATAWGRHMLDGGVLKVLEGKTEADEFNFCGIKWTASTTSTKTKMSVPRDYAFFEMSYTMDTSEESPATNPTDTNNTNCDEEDARLQQADIISETGHLGEKILVKTWIPVGEDVVPLVESLGPDFDRVVRASISLTMVYRFDTRFQAVQIFIDGSTDPMPQSKSTPSYFGSAVLSNFAAGLIRLEHMPDVKFICQQGLIFDKESSSKEDEQSSLNPAALNRLNASDLTPGLAPFPGSSPVPGLPTYANPSLPKQQRKVCFVCFKSFKLMRRHRHHCRLCGEAMCTKCMVKLPVVEPENPRGELWDADKLDPEKNDAKQRFLRPNEPTLNEVCGIFLLKFCKKCIFQARSDRKGLLNVFQTNGAAPELQGGLNIYRPPGNNEGFVVGYDEEEDDDDEEHAKRIEALRRKHLEMEKEKNQPRKIMLLDDNDIGLAATPPEASEDMRASDGDATDIPDSEYGDEEDEEDGSDLNFDNFLAIDQELDYKSETEKDEPMSFEELDTRRSNIPDVIDEKQIYVYSGENDPENPLSDVCRNRAQTMPAGLEDVEKSIAEQTALIREINQERAKRNSGRGLSSSMFARPSDARLSSGGAEDRNSQGKVSSAPAARMSVAPSTATTTMSFESV